MSLYYCLANTVVNGETVIQGSSVTYSATASALDSSDKSFKAAAKTATINSNKAAISAARKTVDSILARYSYVLSEENITSMISNNLKTVVSPIVLISLESIADTIDGINYIGNKNVNFEAYSLLIIKSNQFLTVPKKFKYTGTGAIQIGSDEQSSAGFTKEFEKIGSNSTTINVQAKSFLKLIADPSNRGVYTNNGKITNNGVVTIQNSGLIVGINGSILNSRTGSFLSLRA